MFVFDHLAPPSGATEMTALECFSLLGAVAATTTRVDVGTLVAKSWLRPAAITAQGFASLQKISGGRLIAGMGISDSLSAGEVAKYSLYLPPRPDRLQALLRILESLERCGESRVWIGGSSQELLRIAVTHAQGVNLWNAHPQQVDKVVATLAELAHRIGRPHPPEVSWGGDLSLVEKQRGILADVVRSGATYVVVGVPRASSWEKAATLLSGVKQLSAGSRQR